MSDDGEEAPEIKYGEWEGEKTADNQPNGEGKATYVNNDTFEGKFVNGIRQGAGKYVWAPPPVPEGEDEPAEPPFMGEYSGEYKDHKRHGHGVMKFQDGRRYEGNWVEGLQHGEGVCWYPGSGKYQGTWVQGQKHGFGIYLYKTGNRYKGNWENGARQGDGVLYFKHENSWFMGKWDKDSFESGDWKFSDGSFYTGKFLNNKPTGVGLYTLSTGRTIEGTFHQLKNAPATRVINGVEQSAPTQAWVFKQSRTT